MFVLFISAIFLYLVEGGVQPEQFGSIPRAMWWAMATLTTVGYGDISPSTTSGCFFSIVLMVCGIFALSLPITIIGSKGETGSISAKTFLKVIDPPSVAPKFSRELPSEIELELGKSKPLTVEYLGSAKNITWTLNGKPLPHLFDMSSNPNETGGLCQGTFIS